jgi:hypothetical protein
VVLQKRHRGVTGVLQGCYRVIKAACSCRLLFSSMCWSGKISVFCDLRRVNFSLYSTFSTSIRRKSLACETDRCSMLSRGWEQILRQVPYPPPHSSSREHKHTNTNKRGREKEDEREKERGASAYSRSSSSGSIISSSPPPPSSPKHKHTPT